jgi:DNA-binding beta-propeller fold protein YncE
VSTWGWDVDSTHPDAYAVCTVRANCRAGQRERRGGALSGADGVAISPSGEVYVAEDGNDRISVFTRSGAFVRTWGEGVLGGSGPEVCDAAHAANCRPGTFSGKGGSFEFPRGLDFDQFGELFVIEVGINRVQKFSPSDTFLLAFGKGVDGAGGNRCTVASECTPGDIAGTSGGALNAADGLGVDPDGTVYVADTGNNRISRFTRFGFFEYTWGKGVKGGTGAEVCGALDTCQAGALGTKPGEFETPSRVAVDKAGNWYVPKGYSVESYG